MDYLVANLRSAELRRTNYHGDAYLVAPVVMIVPGVLEGNQGPLFYPAEEISKNVSSWDFLPILLGHPPSTDATAREIAVLERQQVGFLLNARIVDSKLLADAYVKEARLRVLSPDLYRRLTVERKPLEVSTGLGTQKTQAPDGATDNKGRAYSRIAINYKPDHLAILVDSKGACSVDDGCGLGVANETPITNSIEEENVMNRKELIDSLVKNSCCWKEEDRPLLESLDDGSLKRLHTEMEKTNNERAVAEAAVKGFTDPGGNSHTWNAETRKWETKQTNTNNAFPPSKKKKGEAGDEEEDEEENDKKSKANKGKETKNEQPVTTEDWLRTAPPEVQSAVRNSITIERKQKAAIIEQLTADIADEDKEAVQNALAEEPLEKLETLLKLRPKKDTDTIPTVMNYLGQGGAAPPPPSKPKVDPKAVLKVPTINWKEQAAAQSK